MLSFGITMLQLEVAEISPSEVSRGMWWRKFLWLSRRFVAVCCVNAPTRMALVKATYYIDLPVCAVLECSCLQSQTCQGHKLDLSETTDKNSEIAPKMRETCRWKVTSKNTMDRPWLPAVRKELNLGCVTRCFTGFRINCAHKPNRKSPLSPVWPADGTRRSKFTVRALQW